MLPVRLLLAVSCVGIPWLLCWFFPLCFLFMGLLVSTRISSKYMFWDYQGDYHPFYEWRDERSAYQCPAPCWTCHSFGLKD